MKTTDNAKRARKSKPAKEIAPAQDETTVQSTRLYAQVRAILDESRLRATRTVNTEMVRAYWQIGAAIVEYEQAGKERADYGSRLIEELSARLKADGAKGFQARNLWWMRDFYLKFPKVNALRSELSWTHYRLLLKVEKPAAREWYETGAAAQHWSTWQLERQINSFFWERVALSTEKGAMLETARDEAEKYAPPDFVKDSFALELDNGFPFVWRQ